MTRLFHTCLAALALSTAATAPDAAQSGDGAPPERWYEAEHVDRGGAVYARQCAACHGAGGEGAPDWRKRGADGKFPPPPLDGTGHTWHHPFRLLVRQVKFGAPGGIGNMPPFAGKLTDAEILDVLAWVQARWPDEVYRAWWDIQQRSK